MKDVSLARLLEPVVVLVFLFLLGAREVLVQTILVNHVAPRHPSTVAEVAGQVLWMAVLPVDYLLLVLLDAVPRSTVVLI